MYVESLLGCVDLSLDVLAGTLTLEGSPVPERRSILLEMILILKRESDVPVTSIPVINFLLFPPPFDWDGDIALG
jgi:hypothetical protein